MLAEVTDTGPATAEAPRAPCWPTWARRTAVPSCCTARTAGAWPVLRLAGRLGLATRIGLEDTLFLPDGERAPPTPSW